MSDLSIEIREHSGGLGRWLVRWLPGVIAGVRASYRKALAHDRNDYLTLLHVALASSGSARTAAAREAQRLNPLSPKINSLRPYLGLPALSGTKPATAPPAAATTTAPPTTMAAAAAATTTQP